MEKIVCIFCDADDSQSLIEENGFTGRKCNRCGLIFISPCPSSSEIANLYGHDEAKVSAQDHFAAEAYINTLPMSPLKARVGFFLRYRLGALTPLRTRR